MFVINLLGGRLIPAVLETMAYENLHSIIKLVVSKILENKRSAFTSGKVSEDSKGLEIVMP